MISSAYDDSPDMDNFREKIATCQFTLVVAGHFVRFPVPGISYYIFLEAGNHKGMKRAQAVSTTLPPSKKRSVTIKTIEKWTSENDKDLAIAVWLKFEKAGQQCVAALCAPNMRKGSIVAGISKELLLMAPAISGAPPLRIMPQLTCTRKL